MSWEKVVSPRKIPMGFNVNDDLKSCCLLKCANLIPYALTPIFTYVSQSKNNNGNVVPKSQEDANSEHESKVLMHVNCEHHQFLIMGQKI